MFNNWYAEWRQSDFWSHNHPKSHFDTPSTLCPDALTELIARLVPTEPGWIIEPGAGDGTLLRALGTRFPAAGRYALEPRPLALPGVDSRQTGWDTDTEQWSPAVDELLDSLTGPGLLVAVEWLDDLPCPVLEPGGESPLSPADADWLRNWWPVGEHREVGRTRDRAWAWWAQRLPAGSTLLCVDYGHTAADRPATGSFTGYRDGHRVSPAPGEAGRTNLTAAVAVDSLAAAVEAAGARPLARNRLSELTAPDQLPAGLAGLALRSQYAVLSDPARFGDFWLVAHHLPE